MLSQQEAAIREKRTIEATKKNLMGITGKFGTILKAFGHPIIRQGSTLSSVGYLDDPYGDSTFAEYETTASGQAGPVAYRDELLEFDDDGLRESGLLFDGLSRGMHLEVIYWHDENSLTVTYKGYPVYREVAGELEGYAPFDDWENLIDRLFRAAKERLKQIQEQEKQRIREALSAKKRSFLQALRLRWGI